MNTYLPDWDNGSKYGHLIIDGLIILDHKKRTRTAYLWASFDPEFRSARLALGRATTLYKDRD